MQIPKDFPSKDIEDKPISNLRKKSLHSVLRSLLLEKGEEAYPDTPQSPPDAQRAHRLSYSDGTQRSDYT